MPVISSPSYTGSFLSVNKHFETIYPALFRKVAGIPLIRRERLELSDGDFLDIDYARQDARQDARPSKSEKVVIISHGLEGDSRRPYVQGMLKSFYMAGWDVMAWNFRSCGGEMNRLLRFYNSGATEDLDRVVAEAVRRGYSEISLVGFSLGGNMTVKFLGEAYASKYPIKSAVAFSVPLHLKDCSIEIDKWHNYAYAQRFLRSLIKKVLDKGKVFPEELDVSQIQKVKTIFDFDDMFTGPLHGYTGADDYYHRCSSMHFLCEVKTPLLVVNALNDTFLAGSSYNKEPFEANPQTLMLTPSKGGHCGFARFGGGGTYWSEEVATSFCTDPEKWLK